MFSGAASKLNRIKAFTPYFSKCLKSGLIMCAGDILSQIYVKKRDWNKINKEHTIKFAAIGILFTGPLLGYWGSIMRKSIERTSPHLKIAVKRSFATQIFLAPPLNFGIITFSGTMNDSLLTKTNIRDILQGHFLAVMTKNYMIWLPAQFAGCIIRSSIVKFVYTSAVSIIWFAYLSSILID